VVNVLEATMKSEKEKMISGKPYKAFGDELLAERQYAKEMIFDFNSLRHAYFCWKQRILLCNSTTALRFVLYLFLLFKNLFKRSILHLTNLYPTF
jgi:hypothetical protein